MKEPARVMANNILRVYEVERNEEEMGTWWVTLGSGDAEVTLLVPEPDVAVFLDERRHWRLILEGVEVAP